MKKVIILLSIIMFFFKTSVSANYEKIIYDLSIESITGELINFKDYKNKAILIVNTASYCGFTKQYDELQELWDLFKAKGLIVLGVPSNSFNQEKGNNTEIKKFCEVNFNINFPLTTLTDVKGKNAHKIFSIDLINFFDIGLVKDANVSSTFPSLLIKIL